MMAVLSSGRFHGFPTHSPYLLRTVANIQVLLDYRYALFIFNFISNFDFSMAAAVVLDLLGSCSWSSSFT